MEIVSKACLVRNRLLLWKSHDILLGPASRSRTLHFCLTLSNWTEQISDSQTPRFSFYDLIYHVVIFSIHIFKGSQLLIFCFIPCLYVMLNGIYLSHRAVQDFINIIIVIIVNNNMRKCVPCILWVKLIFCGFHKILLNYLKVLYVTYKMSFNNQNYFI